MNISAVPSWTAEGVLPPFLSLPTAPDRSPYRISITDFVLRFANTTARRQLITGLLEFRSEIAGLGIARGFQWINGSFAENVELLEGRPPNDIDVVTYAYLPEGQNQIDLLSRRPDLFDRGQARALYRLDSYFVQLNASTPERLVESSRYWYSVWSHRRSGLWKGYLEISLTGYPLDSGDYRPLCFPCSRPRTCLIIEAYGAG